MLKKSTMLACLIALVLAAIVWIILKITGLTNIFDNTIKLGIGFLIGLIATYLGEIIVKAYHEKKLSKTALH